MPNIALTAVQLLTDARPGKTPANGNIATDIAKSDFSTHLTAVKSTAVAPQTASNAAANTAAATTPALAAKLLTKPQDANPATVKSNPGRKAAAARVQTDAAAVPNTPPGIVQNPVPAVATIVQTPATLNASAVQGPADAIPTPDPAVVLNRAEASKATTKESAAQATASALQVAPQASQANTPQVSAAPAQNPAQTSATANPAIQPQHTGASAHASATASDIASQLANALPAGAAREESSRALHIALTPETLGTITVKIAHHETGDTAVTITASQPETLETLKKDTSSLNQILTNAGVPEAGRQIEFRAMPVVPAQSGAASGNATQSSMQFSGGQQSSQHGTGFASSSPRLSGSPVAVAASIPMPAARGSVDMIA